MRRPNKPHRDGYEDEEDCEGHYDPDEVDRRGCHSIINRRPDDPCEICFQSYLAKEKARLQAEWDAKTPEEKAQHEAIVKGLRELY